MDVNETEAVSLGSFLRQEREKRDLSQDDIAQRIRLRRFIVEAIENEDWARLPPPVFVKGFVRSYAHTLELDESRVLELYQQGAPPEQDTLKAVEAPRPARRFRILLLLLGLAALGCILYFWYVQSSARNRDSLSFVVQPEPLYPELKPAARPEKSAPENLTESRSKMPQPDPPERRLQEQPPPLGPQRGPAEASDTPERVLKALVKEKTWVSIRVDGNGAKEFLFPPGARHQWKGMRGFEVVVGNAAGVNFELDGKKIDNLGQPGQVVRFRLPEGFDPNIGGD